MRFKLEIIAEETYPVKAIEDTSHPETCSERTGYYNVNGYTVKWHRVATFWVNDAVIGNYFGDNNTQRIPARVFNGFVTENPVAISAQDLIQELEQDFLISIIIRKESK